MPTKRHPDPPPADAPRLGRVLLVATLLPLAATFGLYCLNVPLGCPGRFVYLYSPVISQRLPSALAALVLALALGFGTWLLAAGRASYRWFGLFTVLVAGGTLGIWSYVAPPAYQQQHMFNTFSPSQDGAFVAEARKIDSVRDYLRQFPARAQTPPAEMRGTRVISNPPATTLLAVAIDRFLKTHPMWKDAALAPFHGDIPPPLQQTSAVGLDFFWALTGLWLLAGVVLYALGRLFWPPATAGLYAICCAFSPLTLLLTPGKDAAQLLTVAIPLYLWLVGYQRQQVWAAALAGVVFALACLVSLVHVWIGAIVVGATLVATRWTADGWRRALLHCTLPAAAGALLAAIALYVLCGINLPATASAVAHAQAAVTRGLGAMPLAWQTLGVPLFLLFAGPACWTVGLWCGTARRDERARDDPARLGFWLLVGSIVVMLSTVGFTNIETPRLWIPFVPLLLLGGLLQFSVAREPTPRIALIFATLVALQVAAAAAQWSLMDMREAETRLVQQRFFS